MADKNVIGNVLIIENVQLKCASILN